jgi:hypothetical protein
MAADDFGFSWDDDQQRKLAAQKQQQPAGDDLSGDVSATSVDNPMASGSFAPAQTPKTDWGGLQSGDAHGDVSGSLPADTDWNTPSYAQPNQSSASPSAGAGAGASASATMAPYQDTLTKLQQTTDPQQKSMLQDKLARTVFSQLKTAGHDVKWDGDQLIIDGRPYVVAGSQAYEQGGITGGAAAQTASAAASTSNYNTKGYATPQYTATNFGSAPSGWDATKWNDPTYQDPKYVVGRIEMEASGGDGTFDTPAEKQAAVDSILRAYPGATFDGKDMIDFHDGGAPVDVFQGAGTGKPGMSFAPQVPDSGSGGSAVPLGSGTAGTAGVQLGGPSYEQPMPVATPVPAAGTPFQTTAPTYTPGQIGMDDIPNFSYDDLMKTLTDLGPNEGSEDSLMGDILAHPESIDAHTLDSMKAKSKDELAEMGQLDDQNMTSQGYSLGISDSPWLASEKNAGLRDRQSALVKSNRDLELSAAQTNTADKRAAAELGSSYLTAKSGRKTAATALAADTTLRAATVRGDRMALRESVNQKATELGQSADKIQLDYTMGLIDDATRRYGIDVGASIDRAKLSAAGREFQEDLAFRIMALAQADDQFGAQYGLDVEKQRAAEDKDAWDRYASTFGN